MLKITFDYQQLLKTTHVIVARVLWVRITENKLIFEDSAQKLYEYKLSKIREVLITTCIDY